MFQSIWPSGIVDIPIIASPTAAKTYDSRGVCYQNHHKERGPPQPPPKVVVELSNEQEAIKQKILKGKRQRELKKVEEMQERKQQIAQAQEQNSREKIQREKIQNINPKDPDLSFWNDAYEQSWFWDMQESLLVSSFPPKKEEEKREEEKECCVCMDKEPTVTLNPCGHKCICALCLNSISHCPLCRELINKKS